MQPGSQGAFSNGLAGFPHPLSRANLQITPELVRKAAAAPAAPFGVKDIPQVMSGKLNWPKSAALMQRWLDEPQSTMTLRQKLGDDRADLYAKTSLELKLFTMAWLLKYVRASDALDALKQGLATPAALAQLKKLMAGQPLVGKASFPIKNAADPVALHSRWQFQRSPLVESSMAAMDDLSGALGRFMFYAALLEGEVTGSINNSDFDAYRDKTGQGNDLLVFSDVLPFDISIKVQL